MLVDKIIDYESGELSNEDTLALFQELVNSGLAWKLQGHYGRTAAQLIKEGLMVNELPVLLAQGYLIRVSKGVNPLGRPQG